MLKWNPQDFSRACEWYSRVQCAACVLNEKQNKNKKKSSIFVLIMTYQHPTGGEKVSIHLIRSLIIIINVSFLKNDAFTITPLNKTNDAEGRPNEHHSSNVTILRLDIRKPNVQYQISN